MAPKEDAAPTIAPRQKQVGGRGPGPRNTRPGPGPGPARGGWGQQERPGGRGGRGAAGTNARAPPLNQDAAQRAAPQDAAPQRVAMRPSATTAQQEDESSKGEPWRLVDSNWRFQDQRAMKLLSKSPDYIVVGLLGGDAGSKAAFLNQLCGSHRSAKQLDKGEGLPNMDGPDDDRVRGGAQDIMPGIDVRVSGDHVIAIDTHPIQSVSVLSALMNMDTPPTGLLPTIQSIRDLGERDHPAKVPISPYESVAELMDLQMTMWLLRVCHVVCVFGSGLEDQQTWRLLSTAAMLQESLPDVFAPEGQGHTTTSRMADVVLGAVGNHLIKQASGDAIAAARQAAMQCLEGSSLRIVSNESIQVPRWYRIPPRDGDAANLEDQLMRSNNAGFFLLPQASGRGRPTTDNEESNSNEDNIADACDELSNQVLSLVQQQMLKNSGSERDWLQGAERVWAAVLQSRRLKEYMLSLQNTRYRGAGGWRLS